HRGGAGVAPQSPGVAAAPGPSGPPRRPLGLRPETVGPTRSAGAPTMNPLRQGGTPPAGGLWRPGRSVAWVAQSVEQRTRNAQVRSSNLLSGSEVRGIKALIECDVCLVTGSHVLQGFRGVGHDF